VFKRISRNVCVCVCVCVFVWIGFISPRFTVGPCQHSTEPLDSIKDAEFLVCRLYKTNYAPLN
jgi:hypothetical protein